MGKQSKGASSKTNPLVGNWIHIVRVLLFSAAIITAYLSLAALTQAETIPGCGPDSGCDKVLHSKWAKWLNIPVSLPGLGLYAFFFISTFGFKAGNREKAKRSLNALTLCAVGVLAAAVWFVGIQAVAIKSFCTYCCTAHALASVAAILFLTQAASIADKLSVRLNLGGAGAAAAGLVALIAAGQVLMPAEDHWAKQMGATKTNEVAQVAQTNAPPTVVKTNTPPTPAVVTNSPPAPKPAAADPFPIPGAGISLDTSKLAVIGKRDAPNRILLMFDYTCHQCRKLHGFVRQVMPNHKGTLACFLAPMPLDAACNKQLKSTSPSHVNACEYAKICLAVQQVAPDKYDAFDMWLFSDHETAKPLELVRSHAEKVVGKEALGQALGSATLQAQLQRNIEIYELNIKNWNSSSMPQTFINGQVIFGPPPTAEHLENYLKKEFGL
ncbi:MAG: hypothetical protein CMO63_01600 [Verrucomicrobiales bacterium]|nr:hypothetical protein [Verrucomicrobiales bacterium]